MRPLWTPENRSVSPDLGVITPFKEGCGGYRLHSTPIMPAPLARHGHRGMCHTIFPLHSPGGQSSKERMVRPVG